MHPLLDLLPIVLFFVAYKASGIYVATAVLVVAVLVLTLVSWIRFRKLKPLLLAAAAIALVFGGLTLYLHDPTFIKWKPTIASWLFAAVFLASQFTRGPNLLQRMLGEQLNVDSAPVWARANLLWVAFNVAMGGLNLWVAYNFSESTWVNFKLFGLIGLTFAFFLGLVSWLVRKSEEPQTDAPRAG